MSRSFNGTTSDYLSYLGSVVTAEPFTLTAWSKTTTITDAATKEMVSVGFNTDDTFYHGLQRFNASCYAFSRAGGVNGNQNIVSFIIDQWQFHFAIFTSSTDRKPGSGGVVGTSNTTSITGITIDEACIGARSGTASTINENWIGKIAHVGIWDVALTTAQLMEIAGGKHPLDSSMVADLVEYWPLEGTASPEPGIVSGFNMTVVGTTGDTNDNPPVQQRLNGAVPIRRANLTS